ncbi:MAG: LytR/AlgR family response regulator transcription factor [Vulcanimicrobiaceae bacterium]
MLRALICDDEVLVRAELAFVLRGVVPHSEIVEVESAAAALRALRERRFDVLFLDIHMPGLSGIEALRIVESIPNAPPVIIVSAHEDYALAAFEHAAIDYLLKPVSAARVGKALERIGRTANASAAQDPASSVRLAVESRGSTRLVSTGDIRFVEARGHRIGIHLYEETARYRGSLTECERQLEGCGFMRVHRAYLVNLERIVEVCPPVAGTTSVKVDDRDGSRVPISRNYTRALRARLRV